MNMKDFVVCYGESKFVFGLSKIRIFYLSRRRSMKFWNIVQFFKNNMQVWPRQVQWRSKDLPRTALLWGPVLLASLPIMLRLFFFHFNCSVLRLGLSLITRKSCHRCASLTCITWFSCATCINCITSTTEIYFQLISWYIVNKAWILVPQKYLTN